MSKPRQSVAAAPDSGSAEPRRPGRPRGSTRERILDIALELFNEQGYDKTSLREIAERLGHTKAALYYHFERKEDILLELHLRLHALGEAAVELDRDVGVVVVGDPFRVTASWRAEERAFAEGRGPDPMTKDSQDRLLSVRLDPLLQ